MASNGTCNPGHAPTPSTGLRCMGTPPFMFSKGDNFRDFLFAYLEDGVFQKWILRLREKNAHRELNYFLYELTPNEMGGKNGKKDASRESVSIHL